MEQQRAAYAVEGVDEAEPAQAGKKRKKQVHTNGEDVRSNNICAKPSSCKKNLLEPELMWYLARQETGGRLNTKKAKPAPEPRERKNTAIYVTSLPLDAAVQEVHDVFSRCGVIAEEIDRGKPRIKLYTDDNGDFKGDALILYFRAESVDLAIQLLDDTEFRLGDGQKMKVAAADFSYKAQKDAPAKSNMKDKKKIMKKTQKLNKYGSISFQSWEEALLTRSSKLADWDDDDPQALQETSSRWDKVAILKHLFTLKELEVR